MNDPYSVLGVSSNASLDEVKRAYRELAKKYHPDNYANNPLADLAEEKMKAINEAYDAIVKAKTSGGSAYSNENSHRQYSYSNSGSGKYSEIRSAISMNNLALAEKLLAEAEIRDAEWNFLMGSLMLRKGWYDNARSYFNRAYSMEPNNPEYAEAARRMQFSGGAGNMGGAMLTPCDCCAGLMCADCLCDCC